MEEIKVKTPIVTSKCSYEKKFIFKEICNDREYKDHE